MTPKEQFAAKRLEAEQLIRQHAPERLQEQLIALLRPAIALTATRTDDAQIPVGASKFGGAPDVPADFEWPIVTHCRAPEWQGSPMMFVCQWNLAEVSGWDNEHRLPENGVLSFFADTWSYEHKLFHFDNVRARVEDLTPKSPDKPIPCRMNFGALWTIPGVSTEWERHFSDVPWDGQEDYSDAFLQLDDAWNHSNAYMFGYQNPYHDEEWPDDEPAELFCQFCGPKEVWPREEIGWGIGFLTISQSDLARADFSNTWFSIQGM